MGYFTARNGALVWAEALAPLLLLDARRVRAGLPSLSQIARGHKVITTGLLAYLSLHLVGPTSLHRFDPLAIAASHLERTPH